MPLYSTTLLAIDPVDGILKKWDGDYIMADSKEDAEDWCRDNQKGYLKVEEKFISEDLKDDLFDLN